MSFLFVFIGKLRVYMNDALKQVRLWNPTTPIYICVSREENEAFIKEWEVFQVNIVYLDELEPTPHHLLFHTNYQNTTFWKYTMERFFYIEECMRQYQLENVFHHEFDNMIYYKMEDLLDRCVSKQKILIPSDNESRFIAGTCFIPHVDLLMCMNQHFARATQQSDMRMMVDFYVRNQDKMSELPVLPPEYSHKLIPVNGYPLVQPKRLSRETTHFKGVFDAAAIGQYFGGIDTDGNTDGYISPDCAFQVDLLFFQWRKVINLFQPWVSADQEHWYPIYNLHIHRKEMTRWLSDRDKIAHLSNISL